MLQRDRLTDSGKNRISIGRAAVTRRTFLLLADGISLEEWKRIGQQIRVITDSSTWWLGDWLVYGQHKYPDRYRRAINDTSLDYQTLRNYAWVAGRIEPGRRRPGLSFQHHAEVVSLPPAQQDVWLDRAERLAWSRNKLRAQMRAQRAVTQDCKTVSLIVQVESDRASRWKEAAEVARLELIDWITIALDRAASQVRGDEASG
jgi:hypothetical protein